MKNLLFYILIGVMLLSSCKKEMGSEQPFSYWKIGSDSFSTNNVVVEVSGRNQLNISASWNAMESGVSYFSGVLSQLPYNGERHLYTGETGSDPQYLDINFSKSTIGYETRDTSTIVTISRPDGIFTLEIPPSIFRVQNDTLKTVVISAILRYKE